MGKRMISNNLTRSKSRKINNSNKAKLLIFKTLRKKIKIFNNVRNTNVIN